MLPFELSTLILLASAAAAYPQLPKLANVTQTSAPPPTPPNTILPTGGGRKSTASASGFDNCAPSLRTCVFVIPGLTSVTGFEDPDEIKQATKPPLIFPPSEPPGVTVVTTPTVIGIQTNVEPTVTPGDSPSHINQNPDQPGQTLDPSPDNPPQNPSSQNPSNHDLLDDIISRVTNPQQPSGSEHVEPIPQITDPAATHLEGQPMTIGPTSLTLTPGLSTTVGTGTDETFIGITTDGAGQTIITLSSSGTAVTATITNAPKTVTNAKSGFDASLTDAARPGDVVRTSSGSAAAATSSKGVAPDRRRDGNDWWVGLALGIVGVVVF